MATIETLLGKRINIHDLTPNERTVYLVTLKHAGGWGLYTATDKDVPESDKIEWADPSTTWIEFLIQVNPARALAGDVERAQALAGSLRMLVEDIVLRLSILKRGWKSDTIRYEPRRFLTRLWNECGLLQEFAGKNGLDKPTATNILRSVTKDLLVPPTNDISLAAQNNGLAFDYVWRDYEKIAARASHLTCRDFRQQAFGMKALAIATEILRSQPILDVNASLRELLRTEYVARIGGNEYAFDTTINTALANARLITATTEVQSPSRIRRIPLATNTTTAAGKLAIALPIILAVEESWFELNETIPIIVATPQQGDCIGNVLLIDQFITETEDTPTDVSTLYESIYGGSEEPALRGKEVQPNAMARSLLTDEYAVPILAGLIQRWSPHILGEGVVPPSIEDVRGLLLSSAANS